MHPLQERPDRDFQCGAAIPDSLGTGADFVGTLLIGSGRGADLRDAQRHVRASAAAPAMAQAISWLACPCCSAAAATSAAMRLSWAIVCPISPIAPLVPPAACWIAAIGARLP
ncbi:hypothetical protein ASF59_05650 [Methylobacterium sp. Leaf121]|nr:hypothetical protein ASF59_05650 [Methylobacterium sp. Leaf121]